jgi:hypothetical protein
MICRGERLNVEVGKKKLKIKKLLSSPKETRQSYWR